MPLHRRFSLARRPSAPTSDLIKPGIYGASPSPRSVTFAPNVTPTTYKDSDDIPLDAADNLALHPDAQLFPPLEQPPNPPSKRRAPPGKRRSLGYIPRPPNAFMLFRADFVRQKHVPGSIETNHGSLSKIIGNCWRSLPLEEKRIWEIKAKQEKEAHSKRYPGYRFRPVHNKNKDKKKAKPTPTLEDEQRCEEVAQLLLEGIKGDQLAAAIRRLDEQKVAVPVHHPQPFYPLRRPSSVPLPDSRFHPIALPSVSFFAQSSRSASPVNNISRSARMIIGQRRPSSALPHFGRTSWGVDDIPVFPSMPVPNFFSPSLQPDESPLPEVNTSLFEQTFFDANFGFSAGSGEPAATTFQDLFNNTVPPHAAAAASAASYPVLPLDQIPPQDMPLTLDLDSLTAHVDLSANALTTCTAVPMWPIPTSAPSSTYSGSPASSDLSLPVIAPRPQHAATAAAANTFDLWHDDGAKLASSQPYQYHHQHQHQYDQYDQYDVAMGTGVAVAGVDACAPMHGFDAFFTEGMAAF